MRKKAIGNNIFATLCFSWAFMCRIGARIRCKHSVFILQRALCLCRRSTFKKNFIAFFALFLPSIGLAWSAPAHRVIAEIAYSQLQPEVKKKVIGLTAIINKDYHQRKDFESSSLWADQIILHDVSAFNSWHYINFPLVERKMKAPSINAVNIVWAIEESAKVLRSPKSAEFEKAFFLRFLVHLIGDIHQPLHCINRVSAKFPEGDRGGNLYLIQSAAADNLHHYWDRSLGLFDVYYQNDAQQKQRLVKQWARDIQKRYPLSQFKKNDLILEPQKWAKESFYLAKDVAYKLPENTVPGKGYIAQGQKIVQQRLVLAGYRLAAFLNANLL